MKNFTYIFPLIFTTFILMTYDIFMRLYTAQPHPFIDEIFHVPQAVHYCQGNFHKWDPKITTFPGLYLFSIGLLQPLALVSGEVICNIFFLRLVNVIAIILTFFTIYSILKCLHHNKIDEFKLLLYSFNMTTFPVLYWFSFFYYTDVLSTLLVLLMMLYYLHSAIKTSAVIGAFSVLVRQTNVVWVAFFGGLLVIDSIGLHVCNRHIRSKQDFKILLFKLLEIVPKLSVLIEVFSPVLLECAPFLFIILSFLVFIVFNGGIVVGDKESHVATLHALQVAYFSLFILCFSISYCLSCSFDFLKFLRRNAPLVLFAFIIISLLVNLNTMVHPFLLADNRHYTFYIWNRLFGRFELFKYIVIPLYIYGGFVFMEIMSRQRFPFQLLFFGCVFVVLVPQKMLEVRYFILPFLILRLQRVPSSWLAIITEAIYYLLINAVTVYIFLNKTFYWEDLPGPQRIMW